MKTMHTRIFFAFIFLLCSSQASAEQFAWSYTMEEMYQMATSFKNVSPEKELENISQYLDASEFKGYVAAALDSAAMNQDKKLAECARKHPVNVIAMRTAILITGAPLDRSRESGPSVLLSIHFACDESGWKKNK
jgi:hypothetical protein